jgi:hypothetical protein
MDDPEATATQTPPPPATAEVPAVPEAEPAPVEAEAPGPPPAEEEVKEEVKEEPSDPRTELEDERFKPHLERRDRRTAERIRAEEAQNRQAAQVSVDAQEVNRTIQNVYGNIAQKLGEGDTEAVNRLLPRLEAATAPYMEAEKAKLKAEGNQEGQAQLHQGILASVQQSLGQRTWEDMEDYYTSTNGLTWVDILNKYHELRSSGATKSSSEEITSLKAQIEDLKAKVRPEGPDTTQKRGTDGRSDEELKLDPDTPVETLREIRAREKL